MKNKQTRQFVSKVKRIAKIDAGHAFRQAFQITRFELKRRPRIKLASKILLVLALGFILSSYGESALAEKKADIKIGGKQVLVAQDSQKDTSEVEISQAVEAVRSPFEFKMPINGYISQGYSSYHRANDIAGDFGSPIHPLGNGIVEFAGRVVDGKGNIVIVDHGNGLKSLYAHMDRINVGVGNAVSFDSSLGTVGLTGNTTGPHVHLEVYDNNTMVDPSSLLPSDAPVNLVY